MVERSVWDSRDRRLIRRRFSTLAGGQGMCRRAGCDPSPTSCTVISGSGRCRARSQIERGTRSRSFIVIIGVT
jgi:hypothetical protein